LAFVLFIAASLQQIGLSIQQPKSRIYNRFICYNGRAYWLNMDTKIKNHVMVGVILATFGMYLLSVTGDFQISIGEYHCIDGSALLGNHVQLTAYLPKNKLICLSQYQFFYMFNSKFFVAFIVEKISISRIF